MTTKIKINNKLTLEATEDGQVLKRESGSLVFGSGGGSANWGSIGGTLSSQTDLQAALDAKAATSHNHDVTYSPLGHGHSYASVSHSHAISDTTGLQTALDGKSATSHNHNGTYQAPLVSGTNIKTINGVAVLGSGDLPISGSGQSFVVAAGAADSAAVSNSNVNHFSKVVTVAAGDVFWFEVHGRIHNNSGATRTYTHGIGLGGLTLDCVASTTIAANTIAPFTVWGTIAIRSTSSVYWTVYASTLPVSADNGAAVTTITRQAWRTSGTNITGSQTALAYIRSSGTGTQTRWVHGYMLRQVPAI